MRDSEFRTHIPELPKRNDEELSRKPLLTGTPSESEVLPILNEKIVTYVRSSVSWFSRNWKCLLVFSWKKERRRSQLFGVGLKCAISQTWNCSKIYRYHYLSSEEKTRERRIFSFKPVTRPRDSLTQFKTRRLIEI